MTSIRKYAYWSDRRVRAFLDDNDLGFEKRAWKLILGIPKTFSFEIGDDRRTKSRTEIARRVLRFLGPSAVDDFSGTFPVRIAKGRGRVEFAYFTGSPKGIVTYVQVSTSTGERVGICLFGSLDNMAGWAGAKDTPANEGWSSSAWHAIIDLVRSKGTVNNSQWDDDESISVEIHKVATEQGKSQSSVENEPWTRGYTLCRADDADWIAEVYKDVRLTPERWHGLDVDRIITGALMWVRTEPESITRYSRLRRSLAARLSTAGVRPPSLRHRNSQPTP